MVCVYSYKPSMGNVTPGVSIVSCLKFVRLNARFVRLNALFVTVNARKECSRNLPESVCKTKRTSALFKFPQSAFTFAIHQSPVRGCFGAFLPRFLIGTGRLFLRRQGGRHMVQFRSQAARFFGRTRSALRNSGIFRNSCHGTWYFMRNRENRQNSFLMGKNGASCRI